MAQDGVAPDALSWFEIIGSEAATIMLNYYKRLWHILWENFKAATLDQMVGAFLAGGILIFQIKFGVVHREDVRGSWWALTWPYLCLGMGLFAKHLALQIRPTKTGRP